MTRPIPRRPDCAIGKPLPQRAPAEPYDPELEWERDGQYYHYLTKWMHALQRTSTTSGEERYTRWARELARTGGYARSSLQGRHGIGRVEGRYAGWNRYIV